jgi:hypothetical protein
MEVMWMSEMYCKVYVDTEMAISALEALLLCAVPGEVRRHTIVGKSIEVDLRRNDEFDSLKRNSEDGFLWFRYLLDVVPREGVSSELYIASIVEVLKLLSVRGCRAVPSCDFEDRLRID